MDYKGCVGDYWIMVAFLFLTCYGFAESEVVWRLDTLQLFAANSLTHWPLKCDVSMCY